MSEELAEELHKPIRKHFKKRRVVSKHVDDIWAADLVDMQYYSRSNKGYKYILMIIDVHVCIFNHAICLYTNRFGHRCRNKHSLAIVSDL